MIEDTIWTSSSLYCYISKISSWLARIFAQCSKPSLLSSIPMFAASLLLILLLLRTLPSCCASTKSNIFPLTTISSNMCTYPHFRYVNGIISWIPLNWSSWRLIRKLTLLRMVLSSSLFDNFLNSSNSLRILNYLVLFLKSDQILTMPLHIPSSSLILMPINVLLVSNHLMLSKTQMIMVSLIPYRLLGIRIPLNSIHRVRNHHKWLTRLIHS